MLTPSAVDAESRALLFSDNDVRAQLLSELTALATTACPPFSLRLLLSALDVAAAYPALGALLFVSPRRVDTALEQTLAHWLIREAQEAQTPRANSTACHHAATAFSPSAWNDCPLCAWTRQWPLSFWSALQQSPIGHEAKTRMARAGPVTVSISVRCGLRALPSFLAPIGLSPCDRPLDSAIGAGVWVRVIGTVAGVFFAQRSSQSPVPMIEFQPLRANEDGGIGHAPLWLDLTQIPSHDACAVSVVGERVDVIGLLDVAESPLLTRREKRGSALILEARTVRSATFTAPWAVDFGPRGHNDTRHNTPSVFHHTEAEETDAARQALYCWECIAGAAAFATCNKSHSPAALFAAAEVFSLPTHLWAAVGAVISAANLADSGGAILATVVAPPNGVLPLRRLMTALAAETNAIVPFISSGGADGLLPRYARVSTAQAAIPNDVLHMETNGRVEMVRGGLLSAAHRRLLFVPALETVSAAALQALRGAIAQRSAAPVAVVVRDGGQRVTCCAGPGLLAFTQEAALAHSRALFQFIERADVVVHVPATARRPLHVQAEALCNLFPMDFSTGDTTGIVKQCARQWSVCCAMALPDSVAAPLGPPPPSDAAAGLLRKYFLAAKAVCAEAADASVMSALVRLAGAHAHMRHRAQDVERVGRSHRTGNAGGTMALIDALVAVTLCDASLKFIAGVSLIGEPNVFDLVADVESFNVRQYAREMEEHLVSNMPGGKHMQCDEWGLNGNEEMVSWWQRENAQKKEE